MGSCSSPEEELELEELESVEPEGVEFEEEEDELGLDEFESGKLEVDEFGNEEFEFVSESILFSLDAVEDLESDEPSGEQEATEKSVIAHKINASIL